MMRARRVGHKQRRGTYQRWGNESAGSWQHTASLLVSSGHESALGALRLRASLRTLVRVEGIQDSGTEDN